MGFLDNIMTAARGLTQERGQGQTDQTQTQHERSLMDGITDIFKADGINNIMNRFKDKGLGDIISSWIGTGTNKIISATQIREVLGSDRLKQLAQRVGLPEERVSNMLKDLLPKVVDRATPQGNIDPDDSK